MSDIGDCYRWIKTRKHRKKLEKNSGCKIDGRSYINFSNCIFEGHNKIGKFSILNHCIFGYASYIAESSVLENTSVGRFSYVNENIFEEFEWVDKKEGLYVKIGNDVWIGNGVSIMEGVTIADGTIIGAGAVVVKDTEPYSIVGGNPAKVIRYRFGEDEIKFLANLEWWNWKEEQIKKYAIYFNDVRNLREALIKNEV